LRIANCGFAKQGFAHWGFAHWGFAVARVEDGGVLETCFDFSTSKSLEMLIFYIIEKTTNPSQISSQQRIYREKRVFAPFPNRLVQGMQSKYFINRNLMRNKRI
jgi:hypothetical protein